VIFTIYGIWSAFSQQTKLELKKRTWVKKAQRSTGAKPGGGDKTPKKGPMTTQKRCEFILWIYYRQKRSAFLGSYDGCTVMYRGSWPRKRSMYITQVTWCPTFFLQISVYNKFATFAGILDIPIFCWLIKLITRSCDLIPSCCWNNSQSKPHLLVALGP